MSESFQEFCKRILPVVQAGAEGKKIKTKPRDRDHWNPVGENCGVLRRCLEYRIAEPKATPLPITPEMWAMIDQRYRWVVLSPNGEKYACESEPKWVVHDDSNENCWMYGADKLSKLPLNINTAGIIPELSLTKRPDRYDATLDAWAYYKPAIDRAEGDGKGGVISKQFARAVPDVDEVIASIKKTAEEGRKHGVKIATEEFNAERKSSDSGSSKEEIKEWLAQEVKGGVFDPDLTKRMIDDVAGASDGNIDALSFSIMGLPKHANVDATHYAKSITGNHVDLYKRDPLNKEQWMTWDYQSSGWIKVKLFGVEPNQIK